MRKTVIDGSNTTGFQRTCIIATDGWIKVGEKTIPMQAASPRRRRRTQDGNGGRRQNHSLPHRPPRHPAHRSRNCTRDLLAAGSAGSRPGHRKNSAGHRQSHAWLRHDSPGPKRFLAQRRAYRNQRRPGTGADPHGRRIRGPSPTGTHRSQRGT